MSLTILFYYRKLKLYYCSKGIENLKRIRLVDFENNVRIERLREDAIFVNGNIRILCIDYSWFSNRNTYIIMHFKYIIQSSTSVKLSERLKIVQLNKLQYSNPLYSNKSPPSREEWHRQCLCYDSDVMSIMMSSHVYGVWYKFRKLAQNSQFLKYHSCARLVNMTQ